MHRPTPARRSPLAAVAPSPRGRRARLPRQALRETRATSDGRRRIACGALGGIALGVPGESRPRAGAVGSNRFDSDVRASESDTGKGPFTDFPTVHEVLITCLQNYPWRIFFFLTHATFLNNGTPRRCQFVRKWRNPADTCILYPRIHAQAINNIIYGVDDHTYIVRY